MHNIRISRKARRCVRSGICHYLACLSQASQFAVPNIPSTKFKSATTTTTKSARKRVWWSGECHDNLALVAPTLATELRGQVLPCFAASAGLVTGAGLSEDRPLNCNTGRGHAIYGRSHWSIQPYMNTWSCNTQTFHFAVKDKMILQTTFTRYSHMQRETIHPKEV